MAVQLQLRGDTAANWIEEDPVLAEFELGVDATSGRFKIGDGSSSWTELDWSGLMEAVPDPLTFENRADPSVPSTGNVKMYSKAVSGRSMVKTLTAAGRSFPLQPSFFQNQIQMISTGGSTAVGIFGCAVTTVGTVSHPVPTSQYGYMTNFVSAATPAATAGTGLSVNSFMRDLGFFTTYRFSLPAYSANNRVFIGATSLAMSAMVADDNPASSHHVGFMARAADTTWQATSKDGSTITFTNTAVTITAGKVYDAFIYCRGASDTSLNWRLDNVTDGTTAEGTFTATLPGSSTAMKAGVQVSTIDGTAVNIRTQRIYVESDR